MKRKLITVSFALLSLAGCSSAEFSRNMESLQFEFKDPIAKYTSIIYNHQFDDNAVNSPKIVKACKIPEGGKTSNEFEESHIESPEEFELCFKMLVAYKDSRFYEEGTNDKIAYDEFMDNKNFYYRYYFSKLPES